MKARAEWKMTTTKKVKKTKAPSKRTETKKRNYLNISSVFFSRSVGFSYDSQRITLLVHIFYGWYFAIRNINYFCALGTSSFFIINIIAFETFAMFECFFVRFSVSYPQYQSQIRFFSSALSFLLKFCYAQL